MMNSNLKYYLQYTGIDSFQKLYFILFLYQNPDLKGTVQEFAKRLYFADTVFLEEIITDLQSTGLIERIENYYKLCNQPHVISLLGNLAQAFDDPLTRQELFQILPNQPVLAA